MAAVLFAKYKERILQAGLNLSTSDIRVCLLAAAYSYDAADEFMSDVIAHDNGRSAAGLANKTVAAGVFDADPINISATAAVASNALVLFEHTGNDATARLIAYIDRASFTPSVAMVVNSDWDEDGIFAL